MYSVVLMAAMTATTDAPSFGWRHRCACYGGHSCYGAACYGCYGCYGCRGCWGRACYGGYACQGCLGCYGCYGCWGAAPPGGPRMRPADDGKPESVPPPKDDKDKKNSSADGPAKLIIDVPTEAKLFIDDHLMKTTSAKRTFNTPKLEAGETYYYILRAEIEVGDKTLIESKRIIVRAGQTVQASFNDLETTMKRTRNGRSEALETANR